MITFFKIGDKWLGEGDLLLDSFRDACGFVASPKRILEIKKYLADKFNAVVEVLVGTAVTVTNCRDK